MVNEIESLNQHLLEASEAYYNGAPIITDSEYDTLEAQLKALVKVHPEQSSTASTLNHVGNGNNSNPLSHVRPMLSIENHYTEDSFYDASKSYGAEILVEPKRDGISAELTYINGILTRAVTRGDGHTGEDMTSQVLALPNIQKRISTNVHDLRIRGEMVMDKAELERINALGNNYSNTRNLTAGTLKQKDLSVVKGRDIRFIPWDMHSPNEETKLPSTIFGRMMLAQQFGFHKYDGILIQNPSKQNVLDALHRILEDNSHSTIIADGVVLKANSVKVRKVLGEKTKFTNYQHCFKPQHLSAMTHLIDVEFGVGRTGKVTPVGIMEAVDLGGAMVSKATLNNESYMQSLGIRKGCTVEVVRSGDVIPLITSVVDFDKSQPLVPFIQNCPSCGTPLEKDNSMDVPQYFCPSSLCPQKVSANFQYIASREILDIDGMGPEMGQSFANIGVVDIADLIMFEKGPYNNSAYFKGHGFKSAKNALKVMEGVSKSKTLGWDKWLPALSIDGIGRHIGKMLASSQKLNLDENSMDTLPTILLKIRTIGFEGLGEIKLNVIEKWANDEENVKMCEALYDCGVRPSSGVKKASSSNLLLAGKTICITGSFDDTREVISEKLTALGATMLSSVTSKCNLLLAGDKAGSKLDKARAKGIEIVDADWLKGVLNHA